MSSTWRDPRKGSSPLSVSQQIDPAAPEALVVVSPRRGLNRAPLATKSCNRTVVGSFLDCMSDVLNCGYGCSKLPHIP